MSTHKHIDKICALAAALALLLCIFLMYLPTGVLKNSPMEIGYESKLFDTSRVHAIDIQMEDWDSFISSAESEEYSLCTLVIDGQAIANVGIRGKGNTSLSSVSSMDSSRYSFKVEFDQFDSGISYYGLDKLSLNNLIQDPTYMKDYLTYRLMNEFGVAAPLCSFAQISVNGEIWGLYLAVEGVENAFLQRNYGSSYGQLYKPDSLGMGAGRGMGKDFRMDNVNASRTEGNASPQIPPDNARPEMPVESLSEEERDIGVPGGGIASGDVLLQYIDDYPESYSNIFNSAKTNISAADKTRLISSLKTLSIGENIASAVDIDAVIRYFVVHNFVVNGDGYTGGMVHNYYLHEDEGLLSMIPWDYNLAFGTFQGHSATEAVNDNIDSPLSVTGTGRPMIDWIFASDEYTEKYHQYFSQFIHSVNIDSIIAEAYYLISPYVRSDPTAFYSYGEFESAVETLREFCSLRTQSVLAQLSGSSEQIDAGHLDLSAIGSMGSMPAPGKNEAIPPQPPGNRFSPEAETLSGTMPQKDFSESPPTTVQNQTSGYLVLISLCCILLIASITVAWKYKR